jgi:hypothetical protein
MLIHPYTKETVRQFLQDALKSEQLIVQTQVPAMLKEIAQVHTGKKDVFPAQL